MNEAEKMFPRTYLPCNVLPGKTTRYMKSVLSVSNGEHFYKWFRAASSVSGLSRNSLRGLLARAGDEAITWGFL